MSKTLAISSDPRDLRSAKIYRFPIAVIPPFIDKENRFSFDSVRVDSLKGRTKYALQRLKNKPLRIVLE